MQTVAPSTSAGLDLSGNTIARNDNDINASSSAGGSTVVNAANNQIPDSVLAGILANGQGASVYARGNAIFRGQYGLYTTGGTIYSPGDNYVRDATIQDDSTHTADTLL